MRRDGGSEVIKYTGGGPVKPCVFDAEEEWVTKKVVEITTTKNIEKKIQRQVVLEDGRVVEEEVPTVTNDTTEDKQTFETDHDEDRNVEEGDGLDLVKSKFHSKGGLLVGDKFTSVKRVQDVKENLVKTQAAQDIGDIRSKDLKKALREKEDIRKYLRKRENSREVAVVPKTVFSKRKHRVITDKEDIQERNWLNDGKMQNERIKTEEHIEYDSDDTPDSGSSSSKSVNSRHKLEPEVYKTRKDENFVEYFKINRANGKEKMVKVGDGAHFVSESKELELEQDKQNILHSRSPQLTHVPHTREKRADKPVNHTDSWLERHFGSSSSSLSASSVDLAGPAGGLRRSASICDIRPVTETSNVYYATVRKTGKVPTVVRREKKEDYYQENRRSAHFTSSGHPVRPPRRKKNTDSESSNYISQSTLYGSVRQQARQDNSLPRPKKPEYIYGTLKRTGPGNTFTFSQENISNVSPTPSTENRRSKLHQSSSAQHAGGHQSSSAQYAGGHQSSSTQNAGGLKSSSTQYASGHQSSSAQNAGGLQSSSTQNASGHQSSSAHYASGHQSSSAHYASGHQPSSAHYGSGKVGGNTSTLARDRAERRGGDNVERRGGDNVDEIYFSHPYNVQHAGGARSNRHHQYSANSRSYSPIPQKISRVTKSHHQSTGNLYAQTLDRSSKTHHQSTGNIYSQTLENSSRRHHQSAGNLNVHSPKEKTLRNHYGSTSEIYQSVGSSKQLRSKEEGAREIPISITRDPVPSPRQKQVHEDVYGSSQKKQVSEDVYGSSQKKQVSEDVYGSSQNKGIYAQPRGPTTTSQPREIYKSILPRDIYGSTQSKDIHGNTQSKDIYGSNKSKDIYGSTQSKDIYGSTQSKDIYGSTQSKDIYGSSQSKDIYGSNKSKEVYSSTQSKEIYSSLPIYASSKNIYGSSQQMYGSSPAKEIYKSSPVKTSGLTSHRIVYSSESPIGSPSTKYRTKIVLNGGIQ